MQQIMGHGKKKNHQQQNQRNGKQKNLQNKGPGSPFFHNNFVDNNQQQARKQRHKSTDDALDTFGGGSFYNDHLKNQNTSTPIANSGFMTSSSSAFRATNSDMKLTNFSNKKKPNGKNNTKVNQSLPQVTHQDQFKRRLFNEGTENVQPQIKPFSFEMPERWKNFKFDRQKLSSLIY